MAHARNVFNRETHAHTLFIPIYHSILSIQSIQSNPPIQSMRYYLDYKECDIVARLAARTRSSFIPPRRSDKRTARTP